MAHGEQRGFLQRHFFVTEGSALFFYMAKSNPKQPELTLVRFPKT